MKGWLRRLLGTKGLAMRPASAPSNANNCGIESTAPNRVVSSSAGIRTHPAHLALLAKFRHGGDPAQVGQDFWSAVLQEPVGIALGRFRHRGWLIDAAWEDIFASRHKVDDLKRMLQSHGPHVSGKKAELVERLIDADPAGVHLLVADATVWILSADAEQAVDGHLFAEKSAEAYALDGALSALRHGRVREAVDIIVGHERTRLFPRGLGIDWRGDGIQKRMLRRAQAILRSTPSIPRDLPRHELEQLRPIAALLDISGESVAKSWAAR